MTTNEDLSKAEDINTLLLQVGFSDVGLHHRGHHRDHVSAYIGGVVDHLNVNHPCRHRTSIRGGFGGHVGWPRLVMAMLVGIVRGFIGGMAPSIMGNTTTGPKHGALPRRFIHVCFAGDAPSLRHW